MRIQQVKNGLYTSIIVTPSGKLVFLAFEQITSNTYPFWYNYNQYAKNCVKANLKPLASRFRDVSCKDPVAATLMDAFKNELSSFFKMDRYKYEVFLDNNERLSQAAGVDGVQSGIIGLTEAFRQFESTQETPEEKNMYMVYASKVPVRDYAFNMFPVSKKYLAQYHFEAFNVIETCIMQFSLTTMEHSESTSHIGIYRNPMSYLEPSDNYFGISVLLHGFAAECSKEILGKKIQVNKPTQIMADLIINAVGRELVIVDENETKGLEELNHVKNVKGLLIGVDLDHLAKPFQIAYGILESKITPLQKLWRDRVEKKEIRSKQAINCSPNG